MRKKLKHRLVILELLSAGMLALVVAPRPARPAVPARPVQQSSAGPLQGRIILVDAGYGGSDGGARARDSGAWEKDINLKTAQAIREALVQSGATVLMTRESDLEYHRNKRKDLTVRLDIARQGGAQMLLSIHMNEYRSRKESGPQVFYRKDQEQSRPLVGILQDALIRRLEAKKKARRPGRGLLHAGAGSSFGADRMRVPFQRSGRKAAADGRLPAAHRPGGVRRGH